MAMRVLTTKFFSYPVAQWETANNKGVLDLLDVGKLELNKIAQVIKLGIVKGKNETEEEHWARAYERIDNFLAQEDKGLVDLFLQVLREYDMDYKILKTSGMNIDDLEKELKNEMTKSLNKTTVNVAVNTSGMNIDDLEKELENVMTNSLNKTTATVEGVDIEGEEDTVATKPELTVLK